MFFTGQRKLTVAFIVVTKHKPSRQQDSCNLRVLIFARTLKRPKNIKKESLRFVGAGGASVSLTGSASKADLFNSGVIFFMVGVNFPSFGPQFFNLGVTFPYLIFRSLTF